jgi:Carboxypeptidase regulatory-like domain
VPTRAVVPLSQRLERGPIRPDAHDEHGPLTGRVASVSGRPIAGASVCMTRVGESCCAPAACTTADRSGNFVLETYRARSSSLFASADGYLPLQRAVSEVELGSPLVLVLGPGGARISGSVVDASGGPIVHAFLSTRDAGNSYIAVAMTDSSGNFALTVLPGTTQLVAEADGYSRIQREVAAPEDDVRLVMVAASSLVGRVLVEGTEEPIAAIDVTVVNQRGIGGAPHTVATDREGAFRVDTLPAGGYSILALSERWRSDERWVSLGVADQQSIELLVRPASQLRGVVQVDGSRCTDGAVALEGPVSEYRALDEKGEVDFRGIPPGNYGAVVSCAWGVQLSERIQVELEPAVHTWQLDPGITLSGLATTSTGAPLSGAQIFVSPIGSPVERLSTSCMSDTQGEFSCSGLLPGDYECQLRSDSSAEISDSVKVTVSPESSPQITLRAYAGATLRVRIQAGSQLQLGAISVTARRDGAFLLARHETGAFVFEQIPLGSYEVALDPSVPGANLRVELVRAGEVVEATLPGVVTRALSGRVVDETSNGVPDAWVRAAGASPWSQARPASPVLTDAEGAFTIEGLLAGNYQVDVNSPRGEGRLDDVPAGGTVTVPLRTYGSLSGTVSTTGGAPARAFTVAYHQSTSSAVERVSGSNGAWSLPWLAPGTYELEVTASEGTALATVDVTPGSKASMALSLARLAAGETYEDLSAGR